MLQRSGTRREERLEMIIEFSCVFEITVWQLAHAGGGF
jgi:hypothetical protein